MDRPEQPDKPEQPASRDSIFSTPDPYGEAAPERPAEPPTPALDPLDVSTWGPPVPREPDAYRPPPSRLPPPSRRDGPSRRTLAIFGAVGVVAVLAISFITFSLFRSDDPPAVGGGDASPTPSASVSAQPSADETPAASASAEPTPEPTPAGPPVELAVGDWATVTVDELDVHTAPGEDQESLYSLVRGAVMTVAEGPRVANGANWYRIASLGGAAGWVSSGFASEPRLDTILNDPVLIRCGDVANPVFDMVDGVPVARDVLRIGDFAVPANKLNERILATIELARGVGAEVCVTAQVGSNGLPFLRSEPSATACGHAVADGQAFWLRPDANQDADVSAQVKDPALVHPVLMSGPAGHRESSNLRSILTMMSNDGAAGCVSAGINFHANGFDSYRGASIEQCSVVSEYNDIMIKLRPAAGGSTVWIKLPKNESSRDEIPLDIPIDVYVNTDVSRDGIWSNAWSSYSWEREECA